MVNDVNKNNSSNEDLVEIIWYQKKFKMFMNQISLKKLTYELVIYDLSIGVPDDIDFSYIPEEKIV